MIRHPADDTTAAPMAHPIRVTQLRPSAPYRFELVPDEAARAVLARFLGVPHIRKLRFSGDIRAIPGGGWQLSADLGATVVQECILTLAPVSTRIDERVTRRYLPDFDLSDDGGEMEMPEDVDTEPLGNCIDPAAVMAEALALALPPFPRATDAELGEAVFTEPGAEPLRDADLKPLAALAALRGRMGN